MKTYDLVAIGTGAAGSSAAFTCRAAGWEVAIVDMRPYGGTCALRGCDPKKVLVAAEELVDWSHRFRDKAVITGELAIDWSRLIQFKSTFTAPVPEERAKSFAEAGIDAFSGTVRFIDRSTLSVGEQPIAAKHILIAAGAKPRDIPIPGTDLLTTSEQFLDLPKLPQRLVMVGGGYISFEFAHVAARAGAQVTIVHQGTRALEQFDTDLVARLVAATRELGITVLLETSVSAITRNGDHLIVHTETHAGEKGAITTDAAVHGAGRVPDIDTLDLSAGNVTRTEKGVTVNEYLQSSSNPIVYAAGDAADSGGLPLTPVAALEGEIAAANLLQPNSRRVAHRGTPSIVFTSPALAAVGLLESTAKERGLAFRTSAGDTSDWYSSRRLAAAPSGFKVLIEDGSDRILGAHILGLGAEELVNAFALSIQLDLTASQLRNVLFAYPTFSSDLSSMV
ncbi:MAG TPA: NAD(P)/FAD-dependent oxidoreductase [Chloroflexota bacterium]|nr:NAD(P)/FAD-dependent oxidoreductase [Chloroflexota bacterium]